MPLGFKLIETLEGQDAIHRDLDLLENCAHSNLRKFKINYKVLHLSQGNPWHQSRLGDEQMERSPVQKDLGVVLVRGWT